MVIQFVLIFPAYNEAERLKKSSILDDYYQYLESVYKENFRIIVVVNGTSDQTVDIVQNIQKERPYLACIEIKEKGKGRAILAGLKHVKSSVFAFVDIDGAIDPSQLAKMIPYMNDYGVVIGSRKIKGSVVEVQPPFLRKVISCLAPWLINWFCSLGVQDIYCGIKIIREDALEKMLPFLKSEKAGFDVNLLYAAKIKGIKVKEVPIVWRFISGSKVQITKALFYHLRELYRIKYKY